jgi:hypothetical protein
MADSFPVVPEFLREFKHWKGKQAATKRRQAPEFTEI